jgi:hypothetical protein
MAKNKKAAEEDNYQKISPEEINLRYFEAKIDLIKSIVWPLLALAVFVALIYPTIQILNILPSRISEFSVGDLSIKVQQVAKEMNLENLGYTIGELSPTAVEILLTTGESVIQLIPQVNPSTGDTNIIILPSEETMDALMELESKRLLQFSVPMNEYYDLLKNLGFERVEPGNRTDNVLYEIHKVLTDKEIAQLENQTYELTDLGESAFNIIVQSVVTQLEAQ